MKQLILFEEFNNEMRVPKRIRVFSEKDIDKIYDCSIIEINSMWFYLFLNPKWISLIFRLKNQQNIILINEWFMKNSIDLLKYSHVEIN